MQSAFVEKQTNKPEVPQPGQGLSLRELVMRELTSEDFKMPVFNTVALKLQKSLRDRDIGIDKIEELILEDPALAGQILKTANSPFYRGMGDIVTVKEAVLRLGSKQVVNIAMLVAVRQSYSSKNPFIKKQMEKLWEHSFAAAVGCRWIFKKFGGDPSVAFMSGLLHDIGKLGVLKVIEQIQKKSEKAREITDEAVMDILNGSIHTECGYALADSWNLPEPFNLVIRDHHDDTESSGEYQPLLSAVRLMNMVTDHMGFSVGERDGHVAHASPEALSLGLSEIQIAELEIHIEDSMSNTDI